MKTIFFDIDGTLTETLSGNTFKQHPKDVKIIPGVVEGLNYFYDYFKVGISNQGGVASGHKTLSDAIAEMRFTLLLLPQLDFIYFCPDYQGLQCHRVDPLSDTAYTRLAENDDKYSCRKPGAGMLFLAWQHFNIKLSEDVWMVGDRPEDADCAINAGISFLDATLFHQRFTNKIQDDSELLTKQQKDFLFRR